MRRERSSFPIVILDVGDTNDVLIARSSFHRNQETFCKTFVQISDL